MAASLDDILTAQKNGVIAINNLNSTMSSLLTAIGNIYEELSEQYPRYVSQNVTTTTPVQVVQGSGRLFGVSITLSGAGIISVYDSASTNSTSASNLIFQAEPSTITAQWPFVNVNIAFTNGLVIATDATTATFCVTYASEENPET